MVGKSKGSDLGAEGESLLPDKIREKDRAYVLFHATWCPFCRMFMPIFKGFSRSNPEKCFMIDVDERPDLCDGYSVEYYPTVILFEKGKVKKRLDSKPGVGLSRKQLKEFTEEE